MADHIKATLVSGDRVIVNGGVFELTANKGRDPYLKSVYAKKHYQKDLIIGSNEFTCKRLASGIILTTESQLQLEILTWYVNAQPPDEVFVSVTLLSHIFSNFHDGFLKNISQNKFSWDFIPNWTFSIK